MAAGVAWRKANLGEMAGVMISISGRNGENGGIGWRRKSEMAKSAYRNEMSRRRHNGEGGGGVK